jgi:hypothetical protein
MKLFSIGKIDAKYLLFFLFFVLIIISLNCIAFYGLRDIEKYNVSLLVITQYGFSILFIIPEIIINKNFRLKNFFTSEKKTKQIKYIFKDFSRRTSIRSIILDVLAILFFVILAYILLILQIVYDPTSKLIFNENYYFISLFFLYLSTLILYKFHFYSHHKLSMALIIIIGTIRYTFKIVVFHSPNFTFPLDYILLLCLAVIAFFEALLHVYIKLVIEFRYYSPFLINFMVGIICTLFAILILVFSKINCENKFCILINQSRDFDFSSIEIFCLILFSFFYGLYFFCLVMVIRNYSPCHLFLLLQSKEFIINVFYSFDNWNTWKFILILITFILEIMASFAFMEMIELRFCGFDQNLRDNIRKRADSETKIIMKNISDLNEDDYSSLD